MRVFTFDFPPSDNSAYCNRKGGRYLSPRAKTFKQIAELKLNNQIPTDEFFKIDIHLFPPTKAKRDVGNYDKLILDAMSGRIYVDDCQIKQLHIYMHKCDKDNPRIVLEVNTTNW